MFCAPSSGSRADLGSHAEVLWSHRLRDHRIVALNGPQIIKQATRTERNARAGERERGIEKKLQPLQILSFLNYKSSEDKEQPVKDFQWQLRRAEERSRKLTYVLRPTKSFYETFSECWYILHSWRVNLDIGFLSCIFLCRGFNSRNLCFIFQSVNTNFYSGICTSCIPKQTSAGTS